MRTALVRRAVVWALAAFAATPAAAQQILFDAPVRAGDLVLFRDLTVETDYYYVPSRPRLATDASGRPQFSFFRWVENTVSDAKEPEAREGTGGGIIHTLVAFGVPREAVRAAEQDLRRQRPGARIAGPIVPKSGTFALVSSVRDPQGGANALALQVVGLGKAPLLDGDKAAVSVLLTRQGAKVLWEQFQTPTPDISFTFEVEIEGFRAPMRGVIEANLDEIMKHDSFAAGLAADWLGFEIKGAFDELRKNSAIKVTQVGGDEDFNKLVDAAYNHLFSLLFTKAEAPPAAATVGSGDRSTLDRASEWRNAARENAKAVRAENREIGAAGAKERAEREAAVPADPEPQREARAPRGDLAAAQAEEQRLAQIAKDAAAAAEAAEAEASKAGATSPDDPFGGGEEPTPQAKALQEKAEAARAKARAADAEHERAAAHVAELQGKGGTDQPAPREARRAPAQPARTSDTVSGGSDPGFALLGAYQLKRQQVSGLFRVDLNKSTAETRTFRFDENIGDLRALVKDSGHFRQVNLDDPLYRQREIVAMVDGTNAEDFGQFVNFVTVRLRKKHESGALTHEEVRVDRRNFNQEGNAFKLLYGWKGDKSRSRWMDYEYQTVWSFFGGHEIEQPWRQASAGAIALAPPFQRHAIDLRADPKRLAEQEVRSITVRVFYRLAAGAPEQIRQVTLDAAADAVAGRLDFIAPRALTDYDYEITWRLTGNRTVSSGRQTTNATMLDVDDVPRPAAGAPAFPGRNQP